MDRSSDPKEGHSLQAVARWLRCAPSSMMRWRDAVRRRRERVQYSVDPYEAAMGADAVAVLTEWRVHGEIDYTRLFRGMRKPALTFDGRNRLIHPHLHQIGFNVFATGKPPLSHLKWHADPILHFDSSRPCQSFRTATSAPSLRLAIVENSPFTAAPV